MNTQELPITGYLDRFSRRPGETFTAFVSTNTSGRYRARLLRVLSGDPNPHGPGVRFEDLSSRFDAAFSGRRQDVHRGSYAIVDRGPTYPSDVPRSWTVLVRAGVVDGEQALLTQEADDAGVVLLLGTNGASARIRWGSDRIAVATGTPIA